MKAYFTRKPMSIMDVIENALQDKEERIEPMSVNPIANVHLNVTDFTDFCSCPVADAPFLAPYADAACFTDDGADCVIVSGPGKVSLAVCCEGYAYGRYVGWIV